MFEHKDCKRGNNKKIYSQSDIQRGVERYEGHISSLEQENESLRELLVEACKMLDVNFNCKGADHFYDNELKMCRFLKSTEIKQLLKGGDDE